ncbi:MAG: hypothetical protein ACPLRX_05740 [Candidatus Saccharicenans sp.]
MKPEKIVRFNHNPSIQGVTGDRKRERLLELSLPALVKGTNAYGKKFEELTEIKSISAEQAHLLLKTPVQVGSQVNLTVDIPTTVMLGKPIRLELSGQVAKVEMKKAGRKTFQQVVLELKPEYRIEPKETGQNLTC